MCVCEPLIFISFPMTETAYSTARPTWVTLFLRPVLSQNL